jgi:uncharacterized membrane protein
MKKPILKILKYVLVTILASIIVFVITVFIPYPGIDFPEKNYSQIVIKNINQ